MKLNLILTVACYEAKVLKRSWLLRLFALLAFVGITVLQIMTQSSWSITEHYMVALPSSMPFFNAYWFNLLQVFLLVFIVADRFKSGKHVDTTESLRVRPVSNTDYLIGMAGGIFSVLVVLNVISILISLSLNIFASEAPVNVWLYFFYLFTLTIPSCLFILGVSILIYSWIKNAMLALLVLLVAVGLVYVFIPSAGYGIFDLFAREMPNMFSELTGHPEIGSYLLQRLTYVVWGVGLLGFAIVSYPRIPNGKKGKLKLCSGLILLSGILIGGIFVGAKEADRRFRKHMVETFEKYSAQDRLYLSDAEITFEQSGTTMSVKSKLTVQNKENHPVSEIVLFLNPALRIKEIRGESGEAISYRRDGQVVILEKNLAPEEEFSLQVDYTGKIDDRVCYLDISDEEYYDNRWITNIFCFGKRYAFLEKDYTLLEPEVLWYPVTEPPVHWVHPYSTGKNYTNYVLNVIHRDKRTVISQGNRKVSGDTIRFENCDKLTGISLCMGDYTHKSLTVDSVSLDLYFYRGENYFRAPFVSIKDSLPSLVKQTSELMATKWGHPYLYDRLSLLEAPVSFATYIRGWSKKSNYVQPAMVFVPERGITIPEIANQMAKMYERIKRVKKNLNNTGQAPYDEEWTMRSFIDCAQSVFVFPGSEFVKVDFDLLRGKQDYSGTPVTTKVGVGNKHILSSLFQDNRCVVLSKEIPIAGQIFDEFQILLSPAYKTANTANHSPQNEMRVLDYLSEHSLEDAATDPSLSSDMFKLLLLKKCNYLYELIMVDIPERSLQAFMEEFMTKYRYQQVTFEQFMKEFEERFDYKLGEVFDEWYRNKGCSYLETKDIGGYKVEQGEYEGYAVHFKLYNPGKSDILISATASANWLKNARGYWEKRFVLPAGEALEVHIPCDDVPGLVSITPSIVLNQPAAVTIMLPDELEVIRDSTRGLFPISPELFQPDPNVIVVDNEDEGFSLFDSSGKRIAEKRDRRDTGYEELKGGHRWTYIIRQGFYGKYIASAYYKKAGDGKAMVEWKANLPKRGKYELFIYNVSGGSNIISVNKGITQYYTLYFGDKKEEIEFNARREISTPWVSAGTFFFDKGEVRLVMNDKCDVDLVYADAVKWVYVGEE